MWARKNKPFSLLMKSRVKISFNMSLSFFILQVNEVLRYHQHMHGNFSPGLFLTDHTWILLEVVMESGSSKSRVLVRFGLGLGKVWIGFRQVSGWVQVRFG